MKRLLPLLTFSLFFSVVAEAAPRPYHLVLEANPAAPFPFLGKFGKVTLHVYGGGVRAETFWLNGFSRNGAPNLTVENPLGRMYTDVPIRDLSGVVGKLAGNSTADIRGAAPASVESPVHGKVSGIDAARYRISFSPQAWIDIWTTSAIPDNPQLRQITYQFVAGVSPGTAAAARAIPGVPLYVELNFRRYKKLPLMRTKSLAFEAGDEADALKTGLLYFKAPLLDSIWK